MAYVACKQGNGTRAPTLVIKAPFGIGLYGSISIVLFSFIKEKSFTGPFIKSILLAFLTGILLYINISFSEKFENQARQNRDHSYCAYFWVTTFAFGSTMGILTCWILQALGSWNIWLGLMVWAGIYAFSHVSSHDFNLIKYQLENAEVKDRKTYIEWLKLEHSCARGILQVIISLLALVVTGGIVGYFLYQGSFWSPGMYDTVILMVWLIIGMWFGILAPLLGRMYFLGDKMRILASISTEKES